MSWVTILAILTVGAITTSIKAGYDRNTARSGKYDPHRFTQISFAAIVIIACFGWFAYKAFYSLFPVTIDNHPNGLVWVLFPIVVAVAWVAGYLMGRVLAGRLDPPTSFDFVMDALYKGGLIVICCELKSQAETWQSEKFVLGCLKYASYTPHKRDVFLQPVLYEGVKGDFIDEMQSGEELETNDVEDISSGILIDFDNVVIATIYQEL